MADNDILSRIKELMRHFNASSGQFADMINMDRSGFSKRLNGHVAIGDAVLNKIVLALSVNKVWLLTGDGPMISTATKFNEVGLYSGLAITNTVAPLISQYAAAGYLMGFSDQEYIEQQPVYTATKKYSGGNYVAFEIRGDSMDDGLKRSISNGDIVLGKELKKEYWKCKLHIPRVFIIVHKESGILCKEIIDHDPDHGVITCHPFNPQNRDFVLDLNDIAQLFYIKEITRGHGEYYK